MIVVYEVIDDYSIDISSGEEEHQVTLAQHAPIAGTTIKMGGERLWQVLETEVYINAGETITLALVHPIDTALPARAEWNQTTWKDSYPTISMNLKLMPDSELTYYGANMEGNPPTGRLYGGEPTDHPTLLRPVPLPYAVDAIDTYKPLREGSYNAIHVCRIVNVSLPEMAVA
jgi:hypothetical protein